MKTNLISDDITFCKTKKAKNIKKSLNDEEEFYGTDRQNRQTNALDEAKQYNNKSDNEQQKENAVDESETYGFEIDCIDIFNQQIFEIIINCVSN